MPSTLSLTVNGRSVSAPAEPGERLSRFLRERLGLTGLKEGCCEGECGACTVLLDGEPVNSCLVLALQAEGCEVVTVEGLSGDGLGDLQAMFIERGAVQCGYCTPGMLVAAEGLLRNNPEPTDAETRSALAGNICRCTGFQTIIDAVVATAAARGQAGDAA
jgi:aerobic-type carbon monoxide dehydrogenase small subunit (CoxS/CutS family)